MLAYKKIVYTGQNKMAESLKLVLPKNVEKYNQLYRSGYDRLYPNIDLIRIENNSFGVCRVTGKLISKERLQLVPHATLSIEAKKAQ